MSDFLRTSWILKATLHHLGHGEEQQKPPKVVQLIEVRRDKQTEVCKVKLSDKYNYTIAIISERAVQSFEAETGRSVESCRGGLIKLVDFYIGSYVYSTQNQESSVIAMVVEGFESIGGDGSLIHGDPRYIMAVPLVQQLISSFKSPSQIPSSFRPEDLIALDNMPATPEDVFRFEDCLIPEDQKLILDSITPEANNLIDWSNVYLRLADELPFSFVKV